PRADLNLRRVEQRGEERIRNVRRQVRLQPVQAEEPAKQDDEPEMKADERARANVQAEPDRECLSNRRVALGAVPMKQRRQTPRPADDTTGDVGVGWRWLGHRPSSPRATSASVIAPIATTRPSAVTCPSIFVRRPMRPATRAVTSSTAPGPAESGNLKSF